MTIAERIISVCESEEKGNMTKMAKKTGVTPAYISKLKNKPESEPSDIFVKAVCVEYCLNEKWLRTGEGDQFIERTRSEQIAEFIGRVESEDEDSFKMRFINMLANLNEEQWEVLESIGEMLIDQDKNR